MAGVILKLTLLLWLFVTATFTQAPQDPLRDFCRRYDHQTAVIDRKLYIDGGWLYANPIPNNPIPTINQGLLYSDLDNANTGMPAQYANLSKNSSVPDVAGGILWADEVNKVFWLYGGQYASAPSTFQLWGYDVLLNQWNVSSTATASSTPVKRVAYGAGAVLGGKGYYYGGYLNSLTNPLWTGDPLATSTLITFDMDENSLTNNTGPDTIGRAEGVMVSIPASSRGMLVYFGGVSFPYGNATEVPMSMTDIMLYDVGDGKWYTQTATGNVPANRRKFCAGATWAEDQSSYNIYLYGGFGFGENITGFDDVYILTLPTFEWIKWYPEAPGASAPHGSLTCNVIASAQMIVMGGNFTNSTDCDAADVYGQHNLNLGKENIDEAKWYQYLPNLTSYSVPPEIVSVTGGSADGGANNHSPPGGFSDVALSVYFGQQAQFATRIPTRYIPEPTTNPPPVPPPPPKPKRDLAPIIGGAVGGAVGLIILGVAIWFCLKRRKPSGSEQTIAQPALPNTVNELTGDSHHDRKPTIITNTVEPTAQGPYSNPSTPYATPPATQQPTHFVPYAQPMHGVPQQYYYPAHMQQQGYGYPPHMGGSPDGIYPQQGYFTPPPEHMRSSPPTSGVMYANQIYFPPPDGHSRASTLLPQEMPISRTPGVQHIDRMSMSGHSSPRGPSNLSEQERSRFGSTSAPTHRS